MHDRAGGLLGGVGVVCPPRERAVRPPIVNRPKNYAERLKTMVRKAMTTGKEAKAQDSKRFKATMKQLGVSAPARMRRARGAIEPPPPPSSRAAQLRLLCLSSTESPRNASEDGAPSLARSGAKMHDLLSPVERPLLLAIVSCSPFISS